MDNTKIVNTFASVKNSRLMTVTKRPYQSPAMRVNEVQQMQMMCSSNGSFSVSNNGQIEQGDDSDWIDGDLNW